MLSDQSRAWIDVSEQKALYLQIEQSALTLVTLQNLSRICHLAVFAGTLELMKKICCSTHYFTPSVSVFL